MAGDLVLRVIVEEIECAPLGLRGVALDWVVRTRVLAVLAGDFTGTEFAFRVHSPGRAGLAIGVTCTLAATWTGDGYTVDEHQWCGAPT